LAAPAGLKIAKELKIADELHQIEITLMGSAAASLAALVGGGICHPRAVARGGQEVAGLNHLGPNQHLPGFRKQGQVNMQAGKSLARAERKFAGVDLTRLDEDGVFSGYASLFGRVDLTKDAVERGAFRRSLAKRPVHEVRMLFQHDPNQPIGRWLTIREDERGLFVRGQLTPGVAKSQELLKLMRAGAIDGLSIGFRTVRARKNVATGVRQIFEADLWEISIVTFPEANDERLEQIERRFGEDVVTAEKVDRISRALDDQKRTLDRLALKKAARRSTARRTDLADRSTRRPSKPMCARGDDRLLALDTKAMSYGSAQDGGYLVPDETEAEIGKRLAALSPIRSIASVRQVSSRRC
jgi:HK97 family phage prohead protease